MLLCPYCVTMELKVVLRMNQKEWKENNNKLIISECSFFYCKIVHYNHSSRILLTVGLCHTLQFILLLDGI